jgi:hypothetical protein
MAKPTVDGRTTYVVSLPETLVFQSLVAPPSPIKRAKGPRNMRKGFRGGSKLPSWVGEKGEKNFGFEK